jgi:hypothetical protein
MGGDMHAGLSEYYDIPTLSLRNLWLHQILSNYTRMQDIFLYDNGKDYANMLDHYDARHINPWAHGKTAELVSAYIDTQLCEMDRLEETMDKDDIVLDEVYPQQEVPRQLVLDKFAKDKVMPPVHPNCFSTNGVRSPLVAKDNDGWRSWNWQEKVSRTRLEGRISEQSY